MRSKKGGYWVALVLLVGLMSAAVTTGTADEPRAEPSSIACGDVANCTLPGPAIAVTNGGAGAAIRGRSTSARIGVLGIGQPGVRGTSGNGIGIEAHSTNSYGLKATSDNGTGVWADGEIYGVYGQSPSSSGRGVYGHATATSGTAYGVWGQTESNADWASGVVGKATAASGFTHGVQGTSASPNGHGVYGWATAASGPTWGVYGQSDSPDGYGVFGWNTAGGNAGYFSGDVHVNGTLSKAGGSFKIDHPLDPENRYLSHSFVESPDMMNVYNGNVVLDERGQAWVELPDYFEALNRDFRYQLTCIGGFAPVYIAHEILDNRFQIAGGEPGLGISWQVTGIRQDPWANANRIPVEEEKPMDERGYYLDPKVYGQPDSMGIQATHGLE